MNDIPVAKSICLFGEVGLSGEIRPVQKAESRTSEAERMGFESVYLPQKNAPKKKLGIGTIALRTVEDLLEKLFA